MECVCDLVVVDTKTISRSRETSIEIFYLSFKMYKISKKILSISLFCLT